MRTASLRAVPLALVMTLASSCGPPPAPPGPGEARGSVPDLRGSQVIVLPVQLKTGLPQDLQADPEMAHALRSRGAGVEWTFPPELDELLQRSPGVRVPIRALPVHVFLQAEVNRVGDPLFGHLVRLGGITGADVALIPVELRYGDGGAFVLAAALVGIRTGRVAWYGVVEGAPGGVSDPAALASVTENLARTLLPFG